MARVAELVLVATIVLCNSLLVLSGPRYKRVTGGRNAERGEVPYQARIVHANNATCGGVIIDYHYVLTARHCFPNKSNVNDARVEAGMLDIRDWRSKVIRKVAEVTLYHKKEGEPYSADIALLKLSEAFPKNNIQIQPVPLLLWPDYVGKHCIVSGWGAVKSGDKGSTQLQVAQVNMYSHERCIEEYKYNKKTKSDVFCAGDPHGGKDSCQGDSGGPLVCDGHLAGLVKRGIECGNENHPGLYTNVALYSEWIATILKKKASHIGRP